MVKQLSAVCAGLGVLLGAAAAGQAQTIDYAAAEAMFGEPVTASATGKPQRASDAPVTMDIISAEQIRRSGARDLPGILRSVAGIDVWQWTNGGADVSVRGYNQPYSPRLLVLINGRQVYLDHFGMTSWNSLPVQLEEIRQIEVIKGPNSALFGFNATGGVVNIITVNPLYDDVNSITMGLGTQSRVEGSAVVTAKPSDKLGVRLSAGGDNADAFRSAFLPQRDRGNLVDPLRRTVALNALAQTADNAQLGLEATAARAVQNDYMPMWRFTQTEYDTQSVKLDYTVESRLGLIEAMAYSNFLHLRYYNTTFHDSTADNLVAVAKVQDLFKLGTDHTFRLATEFRHNEMSVMPVKGGTVGYNVYSGSGMWDWAIVPGLTLTTALRLDHLELGRWGDEAAVVYPPFTPPLGNRDYDRSVTEPSYNLGLVWQATAADTVRLSTARGVQIPSLLEYGFYDVVQPPSAFGNLALLHQSGSPGVRPTIVTSYELAYDRSLPALDAKLRSALYYENNQDLVRLPSANIGSWSCRTAPGLPDCVLTPFGFRTGNEDSFFANAGWSSALGGEIGLTGTLGEHWAWGLNYAYETVTDHLTYDATAAYSVNFHNASPRHKLNGHLGYTRDRFEADVYGHYVSAISMPGSVSQTAGQFYTLVDVPAYFALDLRLGYHVNDTLTLALNGTNLNRSRYRQTSGPAVDRQVLATATVRF